MQIGAFQSDMFEGNTGAPSGGSNQLGDKDTILETDLGTGPGSGGTVVDTTKRPDQTAEDWKKKFEPKEDSTPTDQPTDQPTEEEPKFKINPLILIGAGIAAFLFFKKRK